MRERPLRGRSVGRGDHTPPEPPTKVGGLREDILFESKEYPLALPKKDCQGGWRRHKLHIPRRCPDGTGSLIPLLLLFPPQNFAVGALYFPPDNPLETTKGEARGPLLWKPLRGLRRICYGGRWDERWGTGGRYGEGWGMGEKFCIRFVIYFLGWLWYAGGTREPCYVDRPSGGLPGMNQEAEQ